jgi:hypothetical protein
VVNPVTRTVLGLSLLVLGVGTGAVSVAVHAAIVGVGGTHLPIGIVLALAGSGGLFLLGAHLMGSRMGAVIPLAGWLIAVLTLSTTTTAGSQVLPAEPLGQAILSYVLLFGGSALGVAAFTLPIRGRLPRPPAMPELDRERRRRADHRSRS